MPDDETEEQQPTRAPRLNARHYRFQEEDWEAQLYAILLATPIWIPRPQ